MTDPQVFGQFLNKPSAEMLSMSDVMETFVDPAGLEEFWMGEYVNGLVEAGAGKVKFVRGRSGSGKTHFLRHLGATVDQAGYLPIRVNALKTRLATIDDLYRAVSAMVPWDDLLAGCTMAMIHEQLGYEEYALPVNQFRMWAETAQGRSSTSLMNEIRQAADQFVRTLDVYPILREPLRASLVKRTGGELADEATLLRWLSGERIGRQERKGILVGKNIDRKNARAMLLSLAVLARIAGLKGLVILVDNLQVLGQTARAEGQPYYTRTTRDQAYEMIRELIDESHHAPWMFLVFAGDAALYEDQKTGFCSYPALWYRIQPEIATAQVNRFADIVDLDVWWTQAEVSRLSSMWSAHAPFVELSGEVALQQADAWGLAWSGVRRRVASALSGTSLPSREDVSDSASGRDDTFPAQGGL